MSKLYRVRLLTIGLFMAMAVMTHAQLNQPDVPDASWEAHEGGINFAAVLTTTQTNNGAKSVLKLYIRNASAVSKFFASGPGVGAPSGFDIFLNQGNGTRQPLHDHKIGTPQQEADLNSGSARIEEIAPGQTLIKSIDVSPDELAKINSHMIQFSFHLAEKSGKQYDINSTPRQLSASP